MTEGIRGVGGEAFLSLDPYIDIDLFDSLVPRLWDFLDTSPSLEDGWYAPKYARENAQEAQFKFLRIRETKDWYQKNNENSCFWLSVIDSLPFLKEFIETLPLQELGRIKIFVNQPNSHTEFHRDHNDCYLKPYTEVFHDHEFIWINSNKNRRLIFTEHTKTSFIEGSSRALFFNEVDLHGSYPFPHKNFSLRIDGKFTPQLRQKLNLEGRY